MRPPFTCLLLIVLGVGGAAAATDPGESREGQSRRQDPLVDLLAGVVRGAVPREYEKKEDWGRTRAVTRGVRVDGKLRSLKIRRRRKEVPHGLWRHYRVSVVEADHPLGVSVENLRSLGPGRAGCTILVTGELEGWARLRHYNRGLHLGTITAEGRSTLRVSVDCEIGFRLVEGERFPALAIDPLVTASRVEIEGFRLNRIGELKGGVAREIGRALQSVVQERLDGAGLTAKLNRALEKRRGRLRIDPSAVLPTPAFAAPPVSPPAG